MQEKKWEQYKNEERPRLWLDGRGEWDPTKMSLLKDIVGFNAEVSPFLDVRHHVRPIDRGLNWFRFLTTDELWKICTGVACCSTWLGSRLPRDRKGHPRTRVSMTMMSPAITIGRIRELQAVMRAVRRERKTRSVFYAVPVNVPCLTDIVSLTVRCDSYERRSPLAADLRQFGR